MAKDPFADFDLVDDAVLRKLPARTSVDPVTQRRNRFVEGVELQKKLWKDPNLTVTRKEYIDVGNGQRQGKDVQKKPRAWWKHGYDPKTQDPCIYVTVKYGSRSVDLSKGKSTAKLGDKQVIPFFDQLITATNDGHFDKQFEKLAQRKPKA